MNSAAGSRVSAGRGKARNDRSTKHNTAQVPQVGFVRARHRRTLLFGVVSPSATADPSSPSQAEPSRRVIEETETPLPCECRNNPDSPWVGRLGYVDPDCDDCEGTGTIWKVTSRRVQLGVPFEEQAAHAYIKGLHAHIRKAAATVRQAADMLHKARLIKESDGMHAAARAILEPVEGQD